MIDVEEILGPEGPLSEKEIDAWLDSLAPSDSERAARIRDLLRHANGDEMTSYDREICRRELSKLETKSKLKVVK